MINIPNYDYKCAECDKSFSKIVPIDSRDDVNCACGTSAQRQITFVGSVWSPTRNGGMS